METPPIGPCGDQVPGQSRHAFCVDTELFCPAAHFHTRSLEIKAGVNADRYPRRNSKLRGNRQRAVRLTFRLTVQRHTQRNGTLKFPIPLSRTCKADPSGIDTGVKRQFELTARCDIEPVDQLVHQRQHRRIGIALHRIMDRQSFRHSGTQVRHPLAQMGCRIDEQGRVPGRFDQSARRQSADREFTINAVIACRYRAGCFHRFAVGELGKTFDNHGRINVLPSPHISSAKLVAKNSVKLFYNRIFSS